MNGITKINKCKPCFAARRCLYTERMQRRCGGPFSSKTGQIKFIRENICKNEVARAR